MICPIMNNNCAEEKCAWWVEKKGDIGPTALEQGVILSQNCAIKLLAEK